MDISWLINKSSQRGYQLLRISFPTILNVALFKKKNETEYKHKNVKTEVQPTYALPFIFVLLSAP